VSVPAVKRGRCQHEEQEAGEWTGAHTIWGDGPGQGSQLHPQPEKAPRRPTRRHRMAMWTEGPSTLREPRSVGVGPQREDVHDE